LAGKLRNAGVVGCWLSHKRLMTHLASLDVPEYYGHLIVEDDVDIPTDFLLPSDEWHDVYRRVPTDWDMVYFGLTNPIGAPIGERLVRAKSAAPGSEGNWGTHAYMVRHGSIKTKILPWLEHMVDAIDEQYNVKFDDWNVYVVHPAIIKLNDDLSAQSSLLQTNAGSDKPMSY
jgi:GR25 family glycosyltransferase involved in LPS biosynthesis